MQHTSRETSVWRSLDRWRDFLSHRYPGAEVSAAAARRTFRTGYRAWSLDGIEFAEVRSASPQCLAVPSPTASALESYYLPLQLAGSSRGGQDDRACAAEPGSMLLLDSRRPHWREFGARSCVLNVRLPKPMLERHLPDAAAACGRPIQADSGQPAIVWTFLTSLWAHRHGMPAGGASHLSDALARLVAGLFSPLPASETGERPRAADRHRRRLLEFIAANLADPELDVCCAARACGVSQRYVHVLMRPMGRTFSQYLLEHRLERCRAALAAPSARTRSITSIAFAWGFNDAAHFSRSFRHRYGSSPRDFRLNTI